MIRKNAITYKNIGLNFVIQPLNIYIALRHIAIRTWNIHITFNNYFPTHSRMYGNETKSIYTRCGRVMGITKHWGRDKLQSNARRIDYIHLLRAVNTFLPMHHVLLSHLILALSRHDPDTSLPDTSVSVSISSYYTDLFYEASALCNPPTNYVPFFLSRLPYHRRHLHFQQV